MTLDGFEPRLRLPAGQDLVLRALRPEDADDVVVACADPVTQEFLPRLPTPYTRADAEEWITRTAFTTGGGRFAVADAGTDRLVGSAALGPLRDGTGTAQVGYWVTPAARGRGVATAATRALAGYAFQHGTHRLELRTAWTNVASQRVALASGFTREAVARDATVDRAGRRQDRLIWVRLATDPDGPTPRLLPDLPGGFLSDGTVTLRPLGPSDADDTYELRTQADVIATSVPPAPPTRADAEHVCARAAAAWLAGQRAALTIREATTGAYAGEIGLYYQEPPTRQAMIGYSVTAPFRRRGFASRAARLLADWAFTHAGIARLIAGTAPENIGSQRVLESAGFRREGYQLARLPGVGGQRIDDILYALLP